MLSLKELFVIKCAKIITIEELLNNADINLFGMLTNNPNHCLSHILPLVNQSAYALRERGHQYVLPQLKYDFTRKSFLNRCLFKFINTNVNF